MRIFLVIVILLVLGHFGILQKGWANQHISFIPGCLMGTVAWLIIIQDIREAFGKKK